MAGDIDREHDLTHVTAEEYAEKIRHAEQLSSCPCTNCIERCWDIESITECRPYRRWWRRCNGLPMPKRSGEGDDHR